MSYVSLHTANEIYSCTQSLRMQRWSVHHDEFQNYCFAIRKFERKLRDATRDSYWFPFLRLLRRYRFELTVALLPFDYQGHSGIEAEQRFRSHLSNCEFVYPECVDDALGLLDMYSRLIRTNDNPDLDLIKNIPGLQDSQNTAIVIVKSGLIKPSQEALRTEHGIPEIRVLGVPQLRDERCFSSLTLLGSAQLFPEYVFLSPRAPLIHFVCYSWVPSNYHRSTFFTYSMHSEKGNKETVQDDSAIGNNRPHTSTDVAEEITLQPEELVDGIDWEVIKRRALAHAGEYAAPEGYSEEVEACLFLLEGDQIVPLDSDETSKINTLDFGRGDKPVIMRVSVKEIEPDMFILLRTEGGGSYIVEVADNILGEQAITARSAQRHWKRLLREYVDPLTMNQAVNKLKAHGSPRANEANIRNWMSYRSIRTRDYRDFKAIMSFIGLKDKIDEYWETMEIIASAHRRAGQLIGRLLLNAVLESNIQDAEIRGRIDFHLAIPGAGSLTAFRVKEIYGGTVQIPVYQLGHPIAQEDI